MSTRSDLGKFRASILLVFSLVSIFPSQSMFLSGNTRYKVKIDVSHDGGNLITGHDGTQASQKLARIGRTRLYPYLGPKTYPDLRFRVLARR